MFYHPEVLRRRSGCFATICAAVASFVIGRSGWEVPPPPAGAPPPRCSLYLAAQLQLGLVRVLGRQCHRLLDDVAQTLERLHRVTPIEPHIDMSPPRRLLLVPDAQSLMVSLELAPDPHFGVMGAGLPSPTDIPQLRRLLEEPLPPLAPPEAITLREPGPIEAPPAPEEELPEVTPRELELLAEAEELLPYVEEIPELPAPPPAPAPPEEAPPPPKLPPKRRRPPHTDPQPQIPQEQFRAQLLRPHGHCGAVVLLEPPPKCLRPPSELLRTPTCGWLPPELWDLWGRCARPAPRRPPPAPEPPSELEVRTQASGGTQECPRGPRSSGGTQECPRGPRRSGPTDPA
ncbi:meiotic recombination protein REC8 homolog isoform X3 [Columba livia]|uniref:meiotic recombination protein REC8 homolog isoform X3 n=1 Tax=Columba livia TaxID=8932 RepID=UPI0031BAC5E0